jgi:antitoxin component YwqK of YwqJK toxin-antitoxin module
MRLFEKLPVKKGNDKMKETDSTLHIVEIPYETGELQFRYTRKLSSDVTKWIRDGLFQEYHKNGNLASEGNYNNGLEDGLWKDYHENGQIASEGNYLNGNEIGEWYFYDEDGALEDEENYD